MGLTNNVHFILLTVENVMNLFKECTSTLLQWNISICKQGVPYSWTFSKNIACIENNANMSKPKY